LSAGERERLAGSPRETLKKDFRASAYIFWGVLLICALIASAAELRAHCCDHDLFADVGLPRVESGERIVENGNSSGSAVDGLIDSATPSSLE